MATGPCLSELPSRSRWEAIEDEAGPEEDVGVTEEAATKEETEAITEEGVVAEGTTMIVKAVGTEIVEKTGKSPWECLPGI